jgi:hypothetical protein
MKVKQFIGLMILTLSPIPWAWYQTEIKQPREMYQQQLQKEIEYIQSEKEKAIQEDIDKRPLEQKIKYQKIIEDYTRLIDRQSNRIEIIKASNNPSDIKDGYLEYLQNEVRYLTRIKKLLEKEWRALDRGTIYDIGEEIKIQQKLRERNRYNYEQGKYQQSNVCQKEIKW